MFKCIILSAETLHRDLATSQLSLGAEAGAGGAALQRVYGLGLCFPEDMGYCAPSPDEVCPRLTLCPELSQALSRGFVAARDRPGSRSQTTARCAWLLTWTPTGLDESPTKHPS